MSSAIDNNDGVVDKYIGDAIYRARSWDDALAMFKTLGEKYPVWKIYSIYSERSISFPSHSEIHCDR